MVAPIRYLSRRVQEQKIGILQNTEEVKVLEVVGRVGIGTTIFDADYNLDVRGTANISGILSVGQIISGAGNTFSDLTVTGDTDLQSDVIIGGGLTVTGVSTFASDLDVNASIDVSGDVIIGGGLTVTGVSTFQSAALFADGTEAEPSISFINDTDLGLYRPADNEIAFTNGGSESVRITSDGKVGIGTTQPLDSFSKLSVFSSDVVTETRIESTDSAGYASILLKSDDIEGAFYASSAEDVIVLRNNSNTTGTALGLSGTRSSGTDIKIFRETRNVVIGDNSPVSSQTGTANQKLQVQSGAYISGSVGIGTTLPTQKLDVNGNVNIRGELHGPEVFIIDPAAVGDNTGAVRIKGDLYVDGTEFIVDSENILLADYRVGIASTVATNLLLDGAGISIGATNIEKTFTYNNTANTLESSVGLGVTDGGEFKTGTDSVLNRTTLGPTVVNSSLTNLGTLTELNVSGLSTFASDLDINASVDISTNLTVDGLSDLDELNVAGIATFVSDVYVGASLYDNNDVNGNPNEVLVSTGAGVSWTTGTSLASGQEILSTQASTPYYITASDVTSGVSTAGFIDTDIVIKDGNLGIGTISPPTKISISGWNNSFGERNTLRFIDTDIAVDAGQQIGKIEFYSFDSFPGPGVKAYIGAFSETVQAASYISFATNDATFASSPTERLRITSTGNVGIGTDDPTEKLDVNGTLNVSDVSSFQDKVRILNSGGAGAITTSIQLLPNPITNASGTGQRIEFRTDIVSAYIEGVRDTAAGPTSSLRFGSSFGEHMRITHAGNVLIGSSTDGGSGALQVTGTGRIGGFDFGNTSNHLTWVDGSDLTIGTFYNNALAFKTNNTECLRITNAGNVGVGTTIPSQTLDVNGNIRLRSALYDNNNVNGNVNEVLVSTGSGVVWTTLTTGGVAGGLQIEDATAGPYYITASDITSGVSTAGFVNSQFVLDQNGNVGIGSTQPTAKLDVNGNVNITGIATINQLDVDQLSPDGSDYGAANEVPVADGAGGWTWLPVTSAGAGILDAIVVLDEGALVGSSGTATTLDFKGNNIIAIGTAGSNIATITVSDTPTFDSLSVTGVSTFTGAADFNGNVDIDGFTELDDVNVSGAITATTFSGDLSGNAGTATALETARTFEITGDVVASAISFDGTGNVSLAATIQPNSVALGTDTTGDYVESISGTANQITVTGGTGEGSTPTLSIPNQFTIPQDATVTRDLSVLRDLNVTGNITVGGTSATLFTSTLQVEDADIILGIRTDAFGNDISNDNTANHGGIAIASTEGNPLVDLTVVGIETVPTTYKKIMWFKAGTFAGLGTDAWLSNYAIGIGSTQFPTGTRLAAGNVQITEDDISVVRNINASGIITSSGDLSIADKITHIGDTDTAIRFPANDTFTVETAGTEHLRIDSLGNVGIGTVPAAIFYKLDCAGAARFRDGVGYVSFGENGYIRTDAANELRLQMGSNGTTFWNASNSTEYARIDSAGNVGIGITNPGAKLHVGGTSTPTSTATPTAIRLDNTFTASPAGNQKLKFYLYNDGSESYGLTVGDFADVQYWAGGSANGVHRWFTSNTEAMRITSAGNVGINSTVPTEKLDVNGNIAINQTTVIGSETASLSTVTETAIHTGLSASTYRSVEYNIQATQGTNFHVTKILALHNGTTAYHNEYGTIFNNSSVATFNVDVSGGNIRLLATGASASQTDYVINFTATKI